MELINHKGWTSFLLNVARGHSASLDSSPCRMQKCHRRAWVWISALVSVSFLTASRYPLQAARAKLGCVVCWNNVAITANATPPILFDRCNCLEFPFTRFTCSQTITASAKHCFAAMNNVGSWWVGNAFRALSAAGSASHRRGQSGGNLSMKDSSASAPTPFSNATLWHETSSEHSLSKSCHKSVRPSLMFSLAARKSTLHLSW